MTFRRSSLFRALVWMGLVLFALRPVDSVDGAAELLASPLRAFAELATPVTLWRASGVSADEGESARDLAEIEALWTDLLAQARPSPALLVGRDPVPAEVVGRGNNDRDRLRVVVHDTTGIEPGLPVVHGDTYVGRVHGVDARTREVAVDLVTGGHFGVGGLLVPEAAAAGSAPRRAEPIWMTVGGIHLAGRGGARVGRAERLALAVSNPSDREAPPGRVEVAELLPDIEPFAELARGYGLGQLARTAGGDPVVLADIDYGAGLYHVFVLCPEGARAGVRDELDLAVGDVHWRPSRPLSLGDPSPWRGGVVVAAGRAVGVAPGAAVISGLRLVGRVDRVGEWSSDVRLLQDPGFTLVAVARLEASPDPHVLGRLISLGPDRNGAGSAWIAFRWEAVVALDLPIADESGWLRAELYTGSGEDGLPGGLYIGAALLPELDGLAHGEAPIVFLERESTAPTAEQLWVRVTGGAP